MLWRKFVKTRNESASATCQPIIGFNNLHNVFTVCKNPGVATTDSIMVCMNQIAIYPNDKTLCLVHRLTYSNFCKSRYRINDTFGYWNKAELASGCYTILSTTSCWRGHLMLSALLTLCLRGLWKTLCPDVVISPITKVVDK